MFFDQGWRNIVTCLPESLVLKMKSRMKWRKTFLEVGLIIILSITLGTVSNFPLIKSYFAGNFDRSIVPFSEEPGLTYISGEEAEELFFSGEAVFIDSRSSEEYRRGHILNAISIPYDEFPQVLGKVKLNPQDTLVVYCDGEGCRSSEILAIRLQREGFFQVKVFFGGWQEWMARGLPVERSEDE